MSIEGAILRKANQFAEVFKQIAAQQGTILASDSHEPSENKPTVNFNKFDNYDPWGDWNKGDTWGKK